MFLTIYYERMTKSKSHHQIIQLGYLSDRLPVRKSDLLYGY